MIDEITDFLFGLKMTIISAVFLVIAIIFMILGIDTPIYLNPAWGGSNNQRYSNAASCNDQIDS